MYWIFASLVELASILSELAVRFAVPSFGADILANWFCCSREKHICHRIHLRVRHSVRCSRSLIQRTGMGLLASLGPVEVEDLAFWEVAPSAWEHLVVSC